MNHNLPFNTFELRAYLKSYTGRRGTTFFNAISDATFEAEDDAFRDIHQTLKVLDANHGDKLETLRTLWQAHINPAPVTPNRVSFQDIKRRKAQQ